MCSARGSLDELNGEPRRRPLPEIGTVKPIKIEEEMRGSYLDYAMSVIVSRALPDVRDGLKPVHRRILFAMDELGMRRNTPYKKSARIVGEVLGKYHPHGDTAVYDAMVRMAQDFSMRYPLIDGQGNFGSVDNDPPAAMRYTEARMAAIAEEMLADLDKETVDFTPNFDGSLKEPVVLPARIPNLLLNGAAGIAVGMATNIPPHNLSELCDGIVHLIENPDATGEDLSQFVKGPDFPTGGIIRGMEGIKNAFATGRGKIVVRAKVHMEEMARGGRYQIIVTELPYQTNKAALVERIADLVKEKKIEGISELRDESDRQGMRIVIELKREAQPKHIRNSLFKYTAMQSSFFVNMLALVGGQPRTLTLKMALQHFISHRQDVITRRSQFDLKKARERAHILEGLKIALDNLDAVIATIRKSNTAESARTNLMREFELSQLQAQAILDMQLRRLAALERQKVLDEYAEVLKTIAYLEDLLANPKKILYLVKEEAVDLKSKYGDARRTEISELEATEFEQEDLIAHQEVVITLSNRGYIKRIPRDTYRLQHRGGKGVTGMVTREADAVQELLVADTHDNLFFFTDRGKVFQLRCYDIPAAVSRTAKGLPLINLISIEQKEKITALVAVPPSVRGEFVVMATRKGEIKKTPIDRFSAVRSNGLIAMDLEEGDELVSAKLVEDKDDVIVVTRRGQAVRFGVSVLRAASRTSGGVRGIRLAPGDGVASMEVVVPDNYLLVISNNGYGRITPLSAYPRHGRGGQGVRTLKVTPKTGELVAAKVVSTSQEVIIISAEGTVIRVLVAGIPARQGRIVEGVRIMNVDEGDSVASVAVTESPGPDMFSQQQEAAPVSSTNGDSEETGASGETAEEGETLGSAEKLP
ncbi:MAG: DNA gyrase subunit A [Chloroflexi bacterium]|nr:DNA gyrase subunit A [Chloroflexota bacterium]